MSEPVPPAADRRPIERVHHGDVVVDPYEWLRDAEDPRVIEYLEAENAHTDARTHHLAGLRDEIVAEITSRTRETDMSVPVRRGDWWYYSRTTEGMQYARHCRCPSDGSWIPPDPADELDGEQLLLDGNVEAAGHEFFSLGAFSISDDARLLAWSVDTRGDERYTLRIKDLESGAALPDEITCIAPGATWSADGRHLFYTRVDDSWRPHQVWRHELGRAQDDDVLVHEEHDARHFVGVGRTNSEKFLVIHVASKITSEVRWLSAADATGEFRVLIPRVEGVEYSAEHLVVGGRDHVAILHNREADNFSLDVADLDDIEHPVTVLPGSDTTRIDDVEAFAHHLAVSYRREAVPRIGLMEIENDRLGPLDEIDFGEELASCGFAANAEWDPPSIRVAMVSFTTPARIYDLDLSTRELTVRKQAPVLADPRGREFDESEYVQYREWAVADDGERIPLSIVARADTPRDGTAPALLYGYGSYEASIDPAFSIPRLSLLDRGFVFAVAHVRGGGEMGRRWYENGKKLTKKNTFTDFVACARHLVSASWTSHDRLVAEGGSAGGLLMGAVANLAPGAFVGILADVPFVDPLTSILDPALPLTVIEWDEWGNPLDDPEAYAYIKSYAPYDNVRAQQYPSILAVTSLHDTRVLYVEPAKWVARLRAESGSTHPILLKTEMSAGHGGVSGRYAAWRERAWELAWIIDTARSGPQP